MMSEKKEFFVAVVGDWGSGKRTFLNALVGEELIPTGILPLRRISTYLHWDKKQWLGTVGGDLERDYGMQEPVLSITLRDGKVYNMIGKEFVSFCRLAGAKITKNTYDILAVIVGEEINVEISELNLHFPERCGFENMCVGGIPNNTDNFWYTDWVEKADAAIFFMDAAKPFTMTDREIVHRIYRINPKLIEEAVVVLTFMDVVMLQLHNDKYTRFTSFIRKNVSEYFHQPIPRIFYVSAFKALEFKESGDEESRIWAEKFEESVQEIMADLHSRRLRESIIAAFSCLPDIVSDLEDKENYIERIGQLEKRFENPEFKLAVIGNFSCGKSTFLNALIGRELLSTSVLPTTAIPTYIRWNKEELMSRRKRGDISRRNNDPVIVLTTRGGEKYNLTESGRDKLAAEKKIYLPGELGEMIDYITTTNSLIKAVERIDLSFPKREGFENFCLIDTPGINPGDEENKDHIMQTQSVLCEDADAIMVLYTAKEAMTADTKKFMEENAAQLMKSATVVLTKMDMVPDKQVDKLLRSTKVLVGKQFHQRNPEVYSISAWRTMEYLSGRSRKEEDKKWAEGFEASISDIISQLHVHRSEIVSQRIASMIREIIETISLSVSEETEELEKENEILQKASSVNLEREFYTIKAAYEEYMKSGVYKRKSKADSIVSAVIKEKKDKICDRIGSASNKEELNSCLSNYYPDEMEKAGQEIIHRINEDIILEINASNKEYISKVEECLNRYNRYLGRVDSRVVSAKNSAIANTQMETVSSIESSFLKDHAAFIAAAGISMMIPGVGLLVIAAGCFWDWIRFDSKKDEAKANVTKGIKEYENNLMAACQESIRQTEEQNIGWAGKLLDEYKSKYRIRFERIEQDHRSRSAALENRIRRNKNKITVIERLKEELAISEENEQQGGRFHAGVGQNRRAIGQEGRKFS